MTLQHERERHDCIKALLARAQDAERRHADLRRALAREHSEWLAFYDQYGASDSQQFIAEVKRYRDEHGCTLREAVQAVKSGGASR